MTQMDHFCDHSIIRARVLVLRSTELMVSIQERKRIACAAFRIAQKVVTEYLAQVRQQNRHIVVDFFRFSGYGRWPGKSPDMNPAESVGAILQESVEDELIEKDPATITREDLVRAVTKSLRRLERNTALFTNLLRSFRHRLDLVKAAGGKNIDRY